MDDKLKKVLSVLEQYNQNQLLSFFNVLTSEEQENLVNQIMNIDFSLLNSIWSNLNSNNNLSEVGDIDPMPSTVWKELSWNEQDRVFETGMQIIKNGKAAAVLVAGGQGTRLGHNGPKGTFSIGLPSGKTLFQLQCERLSNLSKSAGAYIPWYIMTSPENHDGTISYFEKNNYLGYPREHIMFFKQDVLPTVDKKGKILLETKDTVSAGPNGNGGCFISMKKAGIVSDMKQRGIEWVHIYGVDNALVIPADPRFLGFAADSGLPAASKAVRRINPEEKVGIFAYKNKKPSIIEYTELSDNLKYKTDEEGNLLFKGLSIANHVFNIDVICKSDELNLPYHAAFKKITTVNENGQSFTPSSPNGYKFEFFMFDIFPFLKDIAVLEIEREEEFAPVKNKEGEDSPETARQLVFKLHRKWLKNAGISDEMLEGHEVEISPLTCCCGENLNLEGIKNKLNCKGNIII